MANSWVHYRWVTTGTPFLPTIPRHLLPTLWHKWAITHMWSLLKGLHSLHISSCLNVLYPWVLAEFKRSYDFVNFLAFFFVYKMKVMPFLAICILGKSMSTHIFLSIKNQVHWRMLCVGKIYIKCYEVHISIIYHFHRSFPPDSVSFQLRFFWFCQGQLLSDCG